MKTTSLRIAALCIATVALLASFWGCDRFSDRSEAGSSIKNSIDYTRLEKLPVYVSSIEECTDQERSYVLPDGKLWEYTTVDVKRGEYTNQLPISTDADGNIIGVIENSRYSSSDILKETEGAFSSGFIPAKAGETVRFDGVSFRNETIGGVTSGAIYLRFYGADHSVLFGVSAYSMQDQLQKVADEIEYDEIGNIISFTLNDKYDIAYIRLSFLIEDAVEPVITVNEDIWVPCESYVELRAKKGLYIPAEWHAEVMSAAFRVNSIESSAEGEIARFAYVSDIHFEAGMEKGGKVANLGKVTAGVMQACNVPYLMITGDSTTQSSGYTPGDLRLQMEKLVEMLSPIPGENLMLTVGNHDGATGQKEVNGEVLYYRHQLNNKDRVDTYFSWQRANVHKKFSDDGSYYYIDDEQAKIRYIMLNSFWNDHEADEEGFVTDIYRSFFHRPILGEEQLRWFASVALDMPDGYSAVIGTHNIESPEDKQVFYDIVKAYNQRGKCESSHESELDFRKSSVSADFSEATGEIIAVFQGHNHKDEINTSIMDVPCITITTAGADVRDESPEDRINGTPSETAVDIVTVDKGARKIYLTRLGVGDDREIEY